MNDLPHAIFRSKDHRSPQSDWGELLTSANLGLSPLYLHNVGKLSSHMLRYGLDASDLTISDLRCSMLRGLSNPIPSTHGRAKGVSEAYVILMGDQLVHRLGVSLEELTLR